MKLLWVCGLVGMASASHAEGPGFDSLHIHVRQNPIGRRLGGHNLLPRKPARGRSTTNAKEKPQAQPTKIKIKVNDFNGGEKKS